MKFITVILIIATACAVVVTADIHEEIESKTIKDQTVKSPRSVAGLLETLGKLVEGVIDGDKFVLDVLRLPKDLDLNDIESRELNRLLSVLNDINDNLV